jgi:hypothetical protein
VAVQVVTKDGGEVVDVEHLGSAHTDAELALLLHTARQVLHPGQGELDLGPLPQAAVSISDVADWTRPSDSLAFALPDAGGAGGRRPLVGAGGRVVETASVHLWEVLAGAYGRLGFSALGDETFKALVLARIVEPTSKADVIRVLNDLGVGSPSLRTIFRTLARSVERDYRDVLAKACLACSASTAAGRASLVLYDVTTLYFEADGRTSCARSG